MKYKFTEKLQEKADDFILKCKKKGIIGKILTNSFREYSVKVAIEQKSRSKEVKLQTINIYYRPKTNSYTCTFQEIKDKSIIPTLEKCFYPELSHPPEKNNYSVYIDGSYVEGRGTHPKDGSGYGVIILKGVKKIAEFSGQVNNLPLPEVTRNVRQVLGEIFAAKKAIIWCKENKVDKVTIYYDYEGIKKWATGEWKAKQPLTKDYADFMQSSKVVIRWKKVMSHSGVYWNEKVDKLAREGACGK